MALAPRLFKPAVFSLALVPLAAIAWQTWLLQTGAAHDLGPDPAQALVAELGEWAIRFLVLTLAITPLRRLTGWNRPQQVRRMLGLFTFLYTFLHVQAYMALLLEFNIAGLADDLVERPYIVAGAAGFLMLVPLAVTSTNAMIRRLGGRNWQRLHRLVYLVAVAAVAHLIWLARASYFDAALYGAILATLLALRLHHPRRRKAPSPQP